MLSEAKLPGSSWGEALHTVAHVINLSPVVALQADVPNRVWYGKDVSYNHLCVFGCRVFVHVPKDERSKLDVNTRECIFVGYGHDEFGYRLYDPVEKKLIRSRDVIFMEDHTIEDIGKVTSESPSTEGLANLDPVPETHKPNVVEPGNQSDEQSCISGNHIEDNDDAVDEIDALVHEVDDEPIVPFRRSTRQHVPFSRYSPDEYVLLTDGGEPEYYDEAMESVDKEHWVSAMNDEMKSLYDNHTFELVKLPKDKKVLENRWVY